MTESAYDLNLERKRLAAHNREDAAKYAVLCDLMGIYDNENLDLYLQGAAELETTPGLAETLFDEFSPKPIVRNNPIPLIDPTKLTRKQLASLGLGKLIQLYRTLHPNTFYDPGHGCRTNKQRIMAYVDAIY